MNPHYFMLVCGGGFALVGIILMALAAHALNREQYLLNSKDLLMRKMHPSELSDRNNSIPLTRTIGI